MSISKTTRWPEDRLAKLRAMWATTSNAEIAAALGVSKGRISQIARVLGLPSKAYLRTAPRAPEAHKPVAAPSLIRQPHASTRAPQHLFSPLPGNKHRVCHAVGHHLCQWPMSEMHEPELHFCGDKVVPGKPYCPKHAGCAYVLRSAWTRANQEVE